MNKLVTKTCCVLVDCNELLVKRNKTKICFINENNLLEGVPKIFRKYSENIRKIFRKYSENIKYVY